MSRPEDNFDELRTLLTYKRHEQPPPGYFVSFSDSVLARIQAERASEYSTWWTWLIERFDAKPVLVGAYGFALSALLFMGFRLSQAFEAEIGAAPAVSGPWLAATPASPILFSNELAHSALSHDPAATSLESYRFFGETPEGLLTPGNRLRLQPVRFNVPGQ
jgi:hypothetical protein